MKSVVQLDTVAALRAAIALKRQAGERIALVPTMGNLHRGHMALVERAKQLASCVVVSVFVNPMQFGENEDYTGYPRTLDQDKTLLDDHGVDILFTPEAGEVYNRDTATTTRVEVPVLSDILCGVYRPGHFVGVTTVVTKFFNMSQPDFAVFGEKDFQQLLLIRRMAEDLAMPVEIVGVPTVREHDGLALSSRNQYLAGDERLRAAKLYETLCWVRDQVRSGVKDRQLLENKACDSLAAVGFAPQYVSIRCANDLAVPTFAEKDLVVLAAGILGKARLIDNLCFHLD